MGDAMVTVDDYDPRVKYLGQWFAAGSKNEYAGTTHLAHNSGAVASFVFNGTSVAVYGTIEPRQFMNAPPPVSTYRIDGSTSYIFAPTPGNTLLYKQQYYKVSNLPAGEHTLVITLIVEDSRFWLDYIEYTPNQRVVVITNGGVVISSSERSAPHSVTSASESTSTSSHELTISALAQDAPSKTVSQTETLFVTTTLPSPYVGGSTPNVTAPSTLQLPPGPPSEIPTSGLSRISLALIIGGAVGGAILLVLAFFLVWRCRQLRRASRGQYNASTHSNMNPQMPTHLGAVIPFNITQSSLLTSSDNPVTPKAHSRQKWTKGQLGGNTPSQTWDADESPQQQISDVPPPTYQEDQYAQVSPEKDIHNVPGRSHRTDSFHNVPVYINESNVP